MKFAELLVLLPCHSLEDFPIYSEGEEAEALLSAWCALWHPALLASVGSVPVWQRIDAPPIDVSNRLIAVPNLTREQLPAGFVARAKSEGAVLLPRCKNRPDSVAAALEALGEDAQPVSAEIAADFLALAYCRLEVELLTRQMRYTTNLDETQFNNEIVAAAQAAVAGDEAGVQTHLQQAFDVLNEARKYFYPVDAYLVDLTLVAPTTFGESLRKELAELSASGQPTPANLLVSASILELMATSEPTTLAAIRQALDNGLVSIVGGDYLERETPLLPLEEIRREIATGLAVYERLLGRRPQVYGRRRYGLSPALPQLLTKFGFIGAVHVTLDDGHFPLGPQCKTRWEGLDSSVIDSLVRLPRDAAKTESFLDFSKKMGESMDMDHVATVLFAHWPGMASPWYHDLRRIARYTPALGKFTTLDDYFTHTVSPGQLSRFLADDYRAPYLKQAIIRRQADPLSSFAQQYRRQAERSGLAAVETLASLLTDQLPANPTPADDANASVALDQAVERVAAALPRQSTTPRPGYLLINPASFSRRVGVDISRLERLPTIAAPIHAAGEATGVKTAVVEVPPLGFAWIEAGEETRGKKPAAPKPMAEGTTLRNEFMEVVINPTTGNVASIHDYRHRDNRLSQQLALRTPGPRPAPGDVWRDPDETVVYSVMAADAVEINSAGPAYGEIVSRGRLVDREGQLLATFRQTARLWFGSRVLLLDIELEPQEDPRADPWNSFYACRFAWNDSDATLTRGVASCREPTEAKRLEAPEYLEIAAERTRTAILSGGLPYHRRSGFRMVDTLLVSRGETARKFRLGIGIDLPNSAAAAWELLAPPTAVYQVAAPPASSSGWLFHVDAKNILATHWEPLPPADDSAPGAGPRGFRVRLLETAGKAGRVTLRSFRPIGSARQVDFHGQTLIHAAVEHDKILLDFAANEWQEIEAVWQ